MALVILLLDSTNLEARSRGSMALGPRPPRRGMWAGWSLNLSEGSNYPGLEGVEKPWTGKSCPARVRNCCWGDDRKRKGQGCMCPAFQTLSLSLMPIIGRA